MVGYRCGIFLVEMWDVHGIMNIVGGRVLGKVWGEILLMALRIGEVSREKVAERQTFYTQFNASDMSIARDSNLKIPKLLSHFFRIEMMT